MGQRERVLELGKRTVEVTGWAGWMDRENRMSCHDTVLTKQKGLVQNPMAWRCFVWVCVFVCLFISPECLFEMQG